MTACLVSLLTGFTLAADPADAAEAFTAVRGHQTVGFAGVDVVYEIAGDGRWHRIAKTVPNAGKTSGRLSENDLATLRKAIASIEWSKLGEKLVDPNVADDFRYEIRVTVGKTKHTVVADGLSAGKHEGLKGLLKTLNDVQQAGAQR